MSGAVRALLALLAVAMMPCCALAFDLGDPWFQNSESPYEHGIEFVIGDIDRPMRFQQETVLVGTAAGGPVVGGTREVPSETSFSSNHRLLRYTHRPFANFAAQFDLGESGKSSGGETALIVGGAVRFLLIEQGAFQLTTQASMHFVPEYDTAGSGTHTSLGEFTVSGKESFRQFGAALIGAFELPEFHGIRTAIYGGPRLTGARGETSAIIDYENPILDGTTAIGNRAWHDVTLKQKNTLDGVLGMRIDFGERWSGRVEGRFAEKSSVSFGISARF